MSESHAIQASTSTSADDSSVGSTNSRAMIDAPKGNDEEGDGKQESKIFSLIESTNSSNKLNIEAIDTMFCIMREACIDKDWNLLEDFLSDDKSSISNEEKRIIFENKDSNICRLALMSGAPFHIIKGIIDLMDSKSPQSLIFAEGSSWLHCALRFATDYFTRLGCKISFDVIELLVSIGGKKLVNMQSKRNKRSSLQLYFELGYCPKVINLLLEVGGLELLEMEDEDGYNTRDFSNEAQRKIIITYLQTLKKSPRVQKHIEAFQAVDVTPKEFYLMNRYQEFNQVRSYLDDENISKEAKIKCISSQTGFSGRPFHWFSRYHGPIDIAEKMVDIVGKEILFLRDKSGNNCLHLACEYHMNDDEDYDYEEPIDIQIEHYRQLVGFLLSRGGKELLLETNNEGETALYNVMMCKLTNLECVKLVVEVGGEYLLAFQDKALYDVEVGGNTILHYASERKDPDREIIKYLVSAGGTRLTEIKNNNGQKAEDSWSDELKEYIAFTTKTLPALSDDLQCPICFDSLFDVHIISQCCHRFCRKCITQSYEKRGNTCPVCRTEFSIRDVKKDPLLNKLAFAVKEEKDAKEDLQKENQSLREQLRDALKRKQDEL